MSRHNTDRVLLDQDSNWQDSAQAIAHETAPRIPRDRAPASLGALLLAVVIVFLLAATVLVACDPTINCTSTTCT